MLHFFSYFTRIRAPLFASFFFSLSTRLALIPTNHRHNTLLVLSLKALLLEQRVVLHSERLDDLTAVAEARDSFFQFC